MYSIGNKEYLTQEEVESEFHIPVNLQKSFVLDQIEIMVVSYHTLKLVKKFYIKDLM